MCYQLKCVELDVSSVLVFHGECAADSLDQLTPLLSLSHKKGQWVQPDFHYQYNVLLRYCELV